MTRTLGHSHAPHLGFTVVVLALLPGVLALLAAGVGCDPLSGSLCLSQAAGACSIAALQGMDRRTVEAPPALLPPPAPTVFGVACVEAEDVTGTGLADEPRVPDHRPLRV